MSSNEEEKNQAQKTGSDIDTNWTKGWQKQKTLIEKGICVNKIV